MGIARVQEYAHLLKENQEIKLPLIHHQNATCDVAFSPIALRRMPNTLQAVDFGGFG